MPTDQPPIPIAVVPSAEGGAPFCQMVHHLRPILELDRLVCGVLDDMGIGPFASSLKIEAMPSIDFSVLHFVILPHKAVWLDFLLEADRPSALKIYETFSGVAEASDADLEDVLRETMNLIHGALKSALKKEVTDVIIPVVPQSIAPARLVAAPGGFSMQSRYLFLADGISLRLTLVARVAPVAHKLLRNLCLANVLVDPLTPDGDAQLVLVKPHTMLNQRLLDKVHDMAEFESEPTMHAVIDPSPLARLVQKG